jgi:hypothetical protein
MQGDTDCAHFSTCEWTERILLLLLQTQKPLCRCGVHVYIYISNVQKEYAGSINSFVHKLTKWQFPSYPVLRQEKRKEISVLLLSS